ncbi:MAG: family 78 glycoside hydrolase catalytic domain, partial [Candidatus Ornithomonoglobus sp.]
MKRDNYGKLSESYWIGGSSGAYPMTADTYTYSYSYRLREGGKAGIVIGARNKDNYLLLEIDHGTDRLTIYDICDNAWENGVSSKTVCGNPDGYPAYALRKLNEIEISVCRDAISVKLNGRAVIGNEKILPESSPFIPRKNMLMLAGADQNDGCIVIHNPIAVIDGIPFKSYGVEQLEIHNGFEVFSNVPCVSVRKRINIDKEIRSAVLYASARGFYNAFVNGRKAGNEYFAPGFTDYRLRIQYQKYDITNMLASGENIVSAIVGQGYYSGFAGYNYNGCVYGSQNSFIARIEIEYADGTSEVIVTDESWELAECEPVIFADYLQGEYYDARLENAGVPWDKCSIVPDPGAPIPTNGEADDLEFSMEEQDYTGAHEVMRLAGKLCGGAPEGDIIYDMGQNMVGTVKIRLRGRHGESIKVRYGEMLRKDGGLYTANLRSAANTDVYILKGTPEGEVFCPDLTAHGFRYVRISGHGCELSDTSIVIEEVTGIVLSNVDRIIGSFECSDELINKLYSNIVWSQRS